MDDGWIVVPNWDKFQHYKDRSPIWIKLYLELDSRDDWLDLTFHERGVLTTVWLEYARSRGVLTVHRLVHHHDNRYGNVMRALDSLLQAGFIEVSASRPLALRALAREEESREEKPARTRARKTPPEPAAEPRTNAAAYQPFNDAPPDTVEVDEAVLELARKWINGDRR